MWGTIIAVAKGPRHALKDPNIARGQLTHDPWIRANLDEYGYGDHRHDYRRSYGNRYKLLSGHTHRCRLTISVRRAGHLSNDEQQGAIRRRLHAMVGLGVQFKCPFSMDPAFPEASSRT